jgi:hemerythrin-like domain-containing protein
MNTATKNLESDHVNILRLIDVMEKMVLTKSEDLVNLEKAVSLIKNYADGFHHAKEETLFFPVMVKRGFSPGQGPIAVMLNEHVQGRNFVKGISEGIDSCKKGNETGFVKIYENMHDYIVLLRNHISKENNVLFHLADNALTENDHLELLKEFEKVENSSFCGGVLKDCVTEIETLEKIFN